MKNILLQMFNRQKKIAAFTMMDILTGMVMMSIVVVMVFYLMSATTQQAHGYQGLRLQLNDFLIMKADLKRRVEAAERIEPVPGGFQLMAGRSGIAYTQSGDHLLRKTETGLDTLYKGISSITLTPVNDETSTGPFKAQLISGITLNVLIHEQTLACYLTKDYGLSEPINQQLYREP